MTPKIRKIRTKNERRRTAEQTTSSLNGIGDKYNEWLQTRITIQFCLNSSWLPFVFSLSVMAIVTLAIQRFPQRANNCCICCLQFGGFFFQRIYTHVNGRCLPLRELLSVVLLSSWSSSSAYMKVYLSRSEDEFLDPIWFLQAWNAQHSKFSVIILLTFRLYERPRRYLRMSSHIYTMVSVRRSFSGRRNAIHCARLQLFTVPTRKCS